MGAWLVVALVFDPALNAVLVEGEGNAVRLPSLELATAENLFTAAINEVGSRLLGGPVIPVRIWIREHDEFESGEITVLTEPVTASGDRRYANTSEVGAAVESATLEPAAAREVVREWLASLDAPPDARTPAWARPGWYAQVPPWISDQLSNARHTPTEPPRYLYLSPLGAILRTQSGDQSFFLKCSPPYFRNESRIVAALARRTPDLVPEVIAIERDESWLLMGDVGTRILGREPEQTWPEAMPRIAALQRAWIGHTDELVTAGAPVRPLGALADALPGFLDREGLGGRLEPNVRARWLDALPRLVDACHELAAIGPPEALIHGDLHPWNVALQDDGLRVFDWSDGAVGQPFVDLPVFAGRTADLALRARIREAYIDGWADLMARDRLERAADLAMTVGALYQVETYLGLVPGIDPLDAKTFGGSDVRWLGRALDTA